MFLALRLGAVASVAVVAAVTAGPALPAQAAGSVKVTAGKPSEFRFTVAPKAGRKGTIVFHVVNKGSITHTFKIDGKVTRRLAAGKSASLTVVFARPGRYPYVCTIPGHAAAGMKGVFVVA
jgi:uncharacterized cupredoxin-like copper-binding protein